MRREPLVCTSFALSRSALMQVNRLCLRSIAKCGLGFSSRLIGREAKRKNKFASLTLMSLNDRINVAFLLREMAHRLRL
jgi:hypothetical protein